MTALNALKTKFKFDPQSPWYFYRKILWWSFVISAGITIPFILVELVKTGSAVFLYYGDYNAQQICFYEHCVEMVRSGNFGWDWLTDLGSNFAGSYSYYMLGSPFFWLMCAFPSTWAPYLMAPMYMVKYMVAAVIAYAYLQRFVKNKNYAVIGAMLYAFSGFQIYNTFFNQFHDSVAFFPLLLIGMEELIQNDRRGVFGISVTINALINYFMFAGQAVFCIVYFLFRLSTPSFKITLKKFLWLVAEAVLGFLMSMFLFLPGALALMGNTRINRSFSELKKMFLYLKGDKLYWQRYGQIFESYFFPPDIPSRVNFFNGHEERWASISMYLPMFAMSGVFSLFTVKKRTWLKSFCIFLTVCTFVPLLNSIFYLFNTSYYARWLYMMIMMFVLATVVALEDRRSKWTLPTGLMTFFVVIVAVPLGLGWYYAKNSGGTYVYRLSYPPYTGRFILYTAIALLGIVLTAWLIRKYRGTKQFETAVLYCVSFMIILYGCVHITNGKQHSHSSTFLVDQCIEGEVKLPDVSEEFYRIDFYRTSSLSTLDNLGLYWGYPSIECFHTIVPPSVMDFYPMIGVTRSVGSRPESSLYGLRAFTSVRYSFIESVRNKRKITETSSTNPETGEVTVSQSVSEKHKVQGFVYVDTQNGYDIYENTNYLPMGFAYTEFMTATEFNKISKSNRHLYLCKYLIVPDNKAEYYSQFMSQVFADDKAAANATTFENSVDERKQMACSDFEYSSSGFNASITLETPNVVFFSVPYEQDGWYATVNGKEAEVLRVTGGFVAVECGVGQNEIVFDYKTPGFAVGGTVTIAEKDIRLPGGLWISLAAFVLFVAYLAYFRFKKHKADTVFFASDYYDDCGANDLSSKEKQILAKEQQEKERDDNSPVEVTSVPFDLGESKDEPSEPETDKKD